MKLNGEEEDEYFDDDYVDEDEEVEVPSSRKKKLQKTLGYFFTKKNPLNIYSTD